MIILFYVLLLNFFITFFHAVSLFQMLTWE